ncbi:MAG: phospholipase [Bacteroidia bacterium]|jgi:predicted esterase
MQEHHIQVTKTARYYTLGNLTEHTKEIWIVIHGYAQLAKTFLSHFSFMEQESRFIIAPEGLNRFYSRGFGGNPEGKLAHPSGVATWMTSEDRESEIADYTAYLETLMQTLVPKHFNGKIMLLGFSQGVATATRWLQRTALPISHLIIYAGEIAIELREPISEKLQTIPVTYITGTRDPLLKPEQKILVQALMQQLHARVVEFEGGHEIKPGPLQQFMQSL